MTRGRTKRGDEVSQEWSPPEAGDQDLGLGADRRIDVARVPPDLVGMVDLVGRWGFESTRDQDRFVAAMLTSHPEQVRAFNATIDSNREAIMRWQASLAWLRKEPLEMTEEEWGHPFWAFLDVLKVREVTGVGSVSPEVEIARARLADDLRMDDYRAASGLADEAFRRRDFRACVEALEPYRDVLSEAQRQKLALARRRAEDGW